MSMQDPIADLITQIRNAQTVGKPQVIVAASRMRIGILKVLQDTGYISGYKASVDGHPKLTINLKYYNKQPVINKITRVSSPGLRRYCGANVPKVLGGLGISILSTSRGIISGAEARKMGVGGELLCTVE